MFGQYLKGIGTYSKAIDVLNRYRLWHWVILPGLVSLLLGGAVVAFAGYYVDDLSRWLGEQWPFDFGEQTFELVMTILSFTLMVVLVLLSLKYVILVLVAPFMGTLSELVEARITGKEPPSVSIGQIIKDVGRGLAIAVRNIFREIFYTLLVTILGLFIPVVGQVLSSILVVLIQSYYLGFGNVDFTLERKRFTVGDTVNFVSSYRWLVMGNGTAFMLFLLIPVVGLILAPGLGTVAATLNSMEVLDGVKYQPQRSLDD
jgi:CysZ protein